MSVPGGLVFADTNILVYAHGVGDQDRRAPVARHRLEELWRDGTGVASSQVLQEFYAVSTRKLTPPLPRKQARAIVASYADWCRVSTDPELIVAASVLEERHTLNFWDALIVEAAQRSMASTLLSEDLQHGRHFGDLIVENPFRGL
jgi:predicted nucleic acid-binding protein